MGQEHKPLPEGVHTVVLGIGDLNGLLRGKRIPAENWTNICESGMALSNAMFVIDMTCDVWDTPYTNWDTGYPDFHAMPIGEVHPIPWEEGVVYSFAEAVAADHQPLPIDPRAALVRVLQKASDMGYVTRIGTELEFYLLDKETLKPRDRGIQVYGLPRAAELEHVLGPIRRHLTAVGIPIEQSNPEYAAGQVEVNIRYDEALIAADRVVTFRGLVKELGNAHGYHATFMSKPFFAESGNGFHVHHSLWKDNQNVMADNGALSKLGRQYLAGLQKHMAEMAMVSATTPNAYRRRQPYSFCPINNAWGIDNRTVGLRVILGNDNAVRVEKRDGSADCNPYLLLALEIAAGLKGIEDSLEPTAETVGNGYENPDCQPIPTDLATAVALARESDLMAEVLGADLLEILIQQSEREIEFIANQVTPVEIERYLENF
jgi:glutamine synthetase